MHPEPQSRERHGNGKQTLHEREDSRQEREKNYVKEVEERQQHQDHGQRTPRQQR
jgi:hypothetical protein